VKRGFAVLALATGLATTAATASPPKLILVVPSVVAPGHVVTVSGSAGGCPVGDTVTLISRAFAHTHDFAGLPAVLTPVRTGGKFRTTTRIPATKSPGIYGVTARCGGGNLGVQAHLRVTATPSLTVSPSVVDRGRNVTLRGSADGCSAGNTVTLISRAFVHTHDFAGLPAVLTRVRAGGTFHVVTRIPATKTPGRYGITARCGGGNLGVLAHLRVLS